MPWTRISDLYSASPLGAPYQDRERAKLRAWWAEPSPWSSIKIHTGHVIEKEIGPVG